MVTDKKKSTHNPLSALSAEELKHLDPCIINQIDWHDFTSFTKDQLAVLGDRIEQGNESLNAFCFTIPPFILGPLPQKIPDKNHFSRQFRWQEVHYSNSIGASLPSGSAARIILLHIITTVIQTREPLVDLKTTVAELMREFGIKPSYGSKGTVQKYEEALMSLMHTIIEVRLTRSGAEDSFIEELRFPIFSRDSIMINDKGLVSGIAKIDDEFARVILNSSVVLDRETVIKLCRSRSPAALDLYIWSTYTNFYLSKQKRANIKLSWEEAYELFSNRDIPKKAFKRDFPTKLSLVEKFYPNLRLVCSTDGLTLWRTKTHVQQVKVRRISKISQSQAIISL